MHKKDVTRFLGIPVDGSKAEMIRKLQEKGFALMQPDGDLLEGEFNGENVCVSVVTNKGRVWRIAVFDNRPSGDAVNTKIRFNNLYRQFLENEGYIPALLADCSISEDEDISYGLTVENKRYSAGFYQKLAEVDSMAWSNELHSRLLEKFTEKELKSPTDEQLSEINYIIATFQSEKLSKKLVWFMISQFDGKYRIVIYYENKYNEANGEDL